MQGIVEGGCKELWKEDARNCGGGCKELWRGVENCGGGCKELWRGGGELWRGV